MIKAIETRYKGYRFRSRLEARWAVFFDALGLDWEYEPEGYDLPSGRYLPDFFVKYPESNGISTRWPGAGYWIEIKGKKPTNKEVQLCIELSSATQHKTWIFFNGIGKSACCFEALEKYQPVDEKSETDLSMGGGIGGESSRKTLGEFNLVFNAPVFCCSGKEYKQIVQAISKARSARFEHGETP